MDIYISIANGVADCGIRQNARSLVHRLHLDFTPNDVAVSLGDHMS